MVLFSWTPGLWGPGSQMFMKMAAMMCSHIALKTE